MHYQEFPIITFFNQINTEHAAIELAWSYKTADVDYRCPKCSYQGHYQHSKRPEIRECKSCGFQHRLRVGTIFQHSKIPMLKWVRAIYLMMMGKRGISALELKRQLGLGSYKTSLYMLHKIRQALLTRDEQYKLEGIIEMDGAAFGKRATGNQEKVIIAVESKSWVNEKGDEIPKAGFAKVYFGNETTKNAQTFVTKDIRPNSKVHTDASRAYLQGLEGVDLTSIPTYNDHKLLESWLPWVHRFISNAKSWIIGTHHGVNSKYYKLYLAEYTYRFNRRHDVKRYFSRAFYCCFLTHSCPTGQLVKMAS